MLVAYRGGGSFLPVPRILAGRSYPCTTIRQQGRARALGTQQRATGKGALHFVFFCWLGSNLHHSTETDEGRAPQGTTTPHNTMSFPGRALQQCWHLVDAKGQTVGRLASQIATVLRGKHKPTFRPNKDMGDTVVVINADQVHFSGKKWQDKLYRWHTGYPGGLKERTASEMLERRPTEILRKAVVGMLMPKGRLRHGFIEPRLHIYAGSSHPHSAQLPESVPAVQPRHETSRMNMAWFSPSVPFAHPESYQASVPPPPRPIWKEPPKPEDLVEIRLPDKVSTNRVLYERLKGERAR